MDISTVTRVNSISRYPVLCKHKSCLSLEIFHSYSTIQEDWRHLIISASFDVNIDNHVMQVSKNGFHMIISQNQKHVQIRFQSRINRNKKFFFYIENICRTIKVYVALWQQFNDKKGHHILHLCTSFNLFAFK